MFSKKSRPFCAIAIFVVIATLLSTISFAVESRSTFIKEYDASISAAGSGKVKVSVSVVGRGVMTKIGCKSIVIYESTDNSNWTYVVSYYDSDYPNFMGANKSSHTASLYHQGTAGRYYKATITVYAGNNSGGGVDYIQTGSVKAK